MSAKVSKEAKIFHPFLYDSCCPKTSSHMCVAQMAFGLGPRLVGLRTINVRQGTGWRVGNVFTRWDIFEVQIKVSSSRHFFYLFQLPIHQRTPTTAVFPAARRVTLSIYSSILAFLTDERKELKALYNALASKTLISPSRSIQ